VGRIERAKGGVMNEKLKKARKDRLWSAEVAAQRIGVSKTTYLRWEHGEQVPHDSTLLLACETFKMSAEQLGFESSFSQAHTGPIPVYSLQLPITGVCSHVDMFTIGMLALTLAQRHYQWTHEELHVKVQEEIRKLDTMTQQHDEHISRRDTLSFLVGIPIALAGLGQTSSTAALPAEEALLLYVTGIPACWKLYFLGELAEVERVLPTAISHLTTLAQQTSPYQKMAASLLSQAHLLASRLNVQKEDFGSSLAHCKQAFLYGQLADDPNLQAASLIRRSHTLSYGNRPTLQTKQEAMQYIHDVSPLLQSHLYCALGAGLAGVGQKQEALRNIELANETFPDTPEHDPTFPYTRTTKYIICLNEMRSYLKLKQPLEAWNAISKADLYVPEHVSPRRMELLKYMVIASTDMNDMEQSEHYFRLMKTIARSLKSDYWLNEISTTYQYLQLKWPDERRIEDLRDLTTYR
jgi:transcriptional regulator with XRE-family HTH domain